MSRQTDHHFNRSHVPYTPGTSLREYLRYSGFDERADEYDGILLTLKEQRRLDAERDEANAERLTR
jgi:hypothetical protein